MTNDADGLNIGAVVLHGDQALERFDANLPLAGVVAVDVRLMNRSSGEFNAGSLKFELLDAGGKALKQLLPKEALKRVMKFYGNSFYRIDARQHTIESYEATALSLNSVIAPQEERRGLLFFEAPRNTTGLAGLVLSITGTKTPVNVKLN